MSLAADPLENVVLLDLKDGRVTIQLRPDLAPKHVERVKKLTREGFYDGIVVPSRHRRLHGADRRSDRHRHRRLEISRSAGRVHQERSFERGTIGAARTNDPNSANSQFFICFAPAPFLNGKYTVWGQVIDGMDVVDKIKAGRAAVQSRQDRQDADRRRR